MELKTELEAGGEPGPEFGLFVWGQEDDPGTADIGLGILGNKQ